MRIEKTLHSPSGNMAWISRAPMPSKSSGTEIRPARNPIRFPDSGASRATTLTAGLPARAMMNGSPSTACLDETREVGLGFAHVDDAHETASSRPGPHSLTRLGDRRKRAGRIRVFAPGEHRLSGIAHSRPEPFRRIPDDRPLADRTVFHISLSPTSTKFRQGAMPRPVSTLLTSAHPVFRRAEHAAAVGCARGDRVVTATPARHPEAGAGTSSFLSISLNAGSTGCERRRPPSGRCGVPSERPDTSRTGWGRRRGYRTC